MIRTIIFAFIACGVLVGANTLNAQKWRKNATPILRAKRHLTKDTFAVISLFPKKLAASQAMQQMPEEYQRVLEGLVAKFSMVDLPASQVDRILVFLETFTDAQWEAFVDDNEKPWRGQPETGNSLGIPPFLALHMTFENKDKVDEVETKFAKFANRTEISGHQVLVSSWGRFPMVMSRSKDGKELLIASKERFQRMVNPKNTNRDILALLGRIWRPYHNFAVVTPNQDRGMTWMLMNGLAPEGTVHLRDAVFQTDSLRVELQPNDVMVMDWRSSNPTRQSKLKQELTQAIDVGKANLIETAKMDGMDNVYQFIRIKILQHLLAHSTLKHSEKSSELVYKIPQKLNSIIGPIPESVRDAQIVKNGRKKVAPQPKVKMTVDPDAESDSFIKYTDSKGWRYGTESRTGENGFERYAYVHIEDKTLTRADCQKIANSKTVQMVALVSVNIEPKDFKIITTMPRLDSLWLEGEITDQQCQLAAQAKNLTYLRLDSDIVSNKGLEALGKCRTLRDVNLFSCEKVTGDGYAHISALPQLTKLNLLFGQLNDNFFKNLAGNRTLNLLNLSHVDGLTDRGVAQIGKIPNLKELVIDPGYGESSVTSRGVLEAVKHHQFEKVEIDPELIDDAVFKALIASGWLYGNVPQSTSRFNRSMKPNSADEVQFLTLNDMRITDVGFEAILDCINAEYLYADESGISDASLKKMSKFRKLKSLSLEKTKLTAVGLAELVGNPIKLVRLESTTASEEMIKVLAQYENLESLSLSSTPLKSDWMIHLKDHPSLKEINLTNTGITDAAVEHLAAAPNLEEINLTNCRVTEKSLKILQQCKKLNEAYLRSTDIPDTVLEKFKAAHPNIKIW